MKSTQLKTKELQSNKVEARNFVISQIRTSWNEQIDLISTKIKRNVGMMKRVRDPISKDFSITLYKNLMEPYFRYCNTVWGQCGKSYIDKLQTLQSRAARIVTIVSYEDADHAMLLREVEMTQYFSDGRI